MRGKFLRNETLLILCSLEPNLTLEDCALLDSFCIRNCYDFSMIFNIFIMSLPIKWYFQSCSHLDKVSTQSLSTSHLIFIPSPGIWAQHLTISQPAAHYYCAPSELCGASTIFCPGFTDVIFLFLVLHLLMLESVRSTSATVWETLSHSKSEFFMMISNISMVWINYFLSSPTLY